MSYLRRLVAKVQAATPRLVPRRSPAFGGAPASFEERDDEVVVAGAPARTAPPNEQRAASLAPPASSAGAQREAPVPQPRSDRVAAAELPRATGTEPSEVQPSTATTTRRRARRAGAEQPGPRARPVEARAPEPAPRRGDDAPLIAATPQREPRAAQRPPAQIAEPIRREPSARERANAAVESTTVVNIAIGRIDVRAAVAAPAKPPREQPFRPRLSLEAHLAGASGDRR
jgi:hypothetical protein